MNKNIPNLCIFSLLSICALNACSTGESYQDKMGRYTPRTFSKNIVPDINVAHVTFNQNLKGRSPASEKENVSVPNDNSLTNKKLYFLSLYDQYETLKKYSEKYNAPNITICPNFHTGLLNHFEKHGNPTHKTSTPNNYFTNNFNDENYLSHHPELYLPLSKDSTTPRVVDLLTQKKEINNTEVNELVHKAIDIHLEKTYFELSELCEYGTSDNYFIYENVTTHIKSTAFNPSETNIKILLKTTVFSNMAIINSLEKQNTNTGRSIASENNEGNYYSKDLFKKLNISWAQDYYQELKK